MKPVLDGNPPVKVESLLRQMEESPQGEVPLLELSVCACACSCFGHNEGYKQGYNEGAYDYNNEHFPIEDPPDN